MTVIYRVTSDKPLRPLDPLHVGNIYEGKERLHRGKMQDRQDLILWLAKLHQSSLNRWMPRGLCDVKIRLTTLRDWVYDYRPALDYFFEVKQLGYNVDDDRNEITTLVPKDLGAFIDLQVTNLNLKYDPGPRPEGGTISKVYLQRQNANLIRARLKAEHRFDLTEAVQWLLNQDGDEVNFIFERAGRLQQRDTSVWPIAAIETWPSWLREQLFGPGIDIDSAYTQYLMQHLKEAHADRPHLISLLYHDLVRLLADKEGWRRELAEFIGLEWSESTRDTIKTICMSLANGSRISPAILSSGVGFSITADIIIQSVRDVSTSNLDLIGRRLQSISSQYTSAKKQVCNHLLRLNPTRRNQKQVFNSYFEWERVARYQLWAAVDQHGLMVHDGLDGVPQRYLDDLPAIIEKVGVKVTT